MRNVDVTMFVCREDINGLMSCLDFSEGGKKVFGCFKTGELSFNAEKTRELDDTELSLRAVRALMRVPSVQYVETNKHYALRHGVEMLSSGERYLFCKDITDRLELCGLERVVVD